MFRGPQLLNWACPIRSLLQQRELHLTAISQYAATVSHGSRSVKKRRPTRSQQTEGPPSPILRGHLHSRNIQPFYNISPKAIYTSHHKPACFLEAQPKHGKNTIAGTDNDCIVCTNGLQSQRKHWVQQHCSPHCKPFKPNQLCSTSSFSPLVLAANISSHNLTPFGFNQTRCVHQTVSHEVAAWSAFLSTENEQRCRQILEPNLKLYEVEKVRRGPSLSLGKKQARWASVLVSLCCVEGEPAFLFTLRSCMLKGRHKGDVSFAGGKSDPSDKDVVATALREAREELGINVGAERVWGVLKPLREMTGMMVAPVLANLGPLEELSFKPNPGEVEEIFTLSLSHLCNPLNRGYTHFRTGDKYGYTLPVFRNGKHRVWGLTAVALDHTLKIICQS